MTAILIFVAKLIITIAVIPFVTGLLAKSIAEVRKLNL